MQNKEFFIEIDGLKLHAKLDFPSEERERYPLFLIIHGLQGHMEELQLTEVQKALNNNGYATLRAEMYGHGQSDGQFYDHNLLIWTQQLIKLIEYAQKLDFVDPQEIHLAGHSQGGAVAILAAAVKREALRSIVLLAPATVLKYGAIKGELINVTFDPDSPEDHVLDEGTHLSHNYIMINRMLPFEDAVKLYKGNVLILHGEEDEAVPYHYAVELAEAYENAKFVTIPDGRHHFEPHLAMVPQAILDFLANL